VGLVSGSATLAAEDSLEGEPVSLPGAPDGFCAAVSELSADGDAVDGGCAFFAHPANVFANK
jgi:hypothetical protein